MTFALDGSGGQHVGSLLPAFHNGTLEPTDQMRVRAHLEHCALCRAESADWAVIKSASRSVWSSEPRSLDGTRTTFGLPLPLEISDPRAFFADRAHRNHGAETMSVPLVTGQPSSPTRHHQAFASAGMIAVIIAVIVGVIGIRPPGNRSDQPPSIPAVALLAEASPTAPSIEAPVNQGGDVATPTSITCAEPASSLDRLDLTGPTAYENAIPLPEAATEGRAGIPAEGLPTGDPASSDQIAAVTSVMEQLIACLNDGNAEKISSFFTDDYWRRMNSMGLDYNASNALAYAPLVRPSSSSVPPMPIVQDVILLPDGRLAASMIPSFGSLGRTSFDFYVFTEVDGKLLIDEAAHSYARPQIDLEVNDDGFSKTTLLVTDGKTDLVLTNTGTTTHGISIPELNIEITLEPGETDSATIVYGEATLEYHSSVADDTGPGFTGVLTIDFPDISVEPTPTPETIAKDCASPSSDESRLSSTGPTTYNDVLQRPADAEIGSISELDSSAIPVGSYVSPEQLASLADFVADLGACFNNGTPLQVASFFTDDYFRRLNAAGITVSADDSTSFVPLQVNTDGAGIGIPAQLAPGEKLGVLPDVSEAIALDDGRIGARVQVAGIIGRNFQSEYYVFTNVDGQWLIDEAAYIDRINEVTINVSDDGFDNTGVQWTTDTTYLTVVNNGTHVHSFDVPELGLSITVQPGESQSMLFGAGGTGTFAFSSTADGDDGDAFTGTVTVTEAGNSADSAG